MSDRKIIYLDDAIDVAKDWYDGLICGSFRGLEKRLKSLPSAQPETLGMICGACDDCDSTVLYLTNPPQVKCKRSGRLHFVTDHCDATSAQPEIVRCKDCEWFRKEYGWNCIEYTVCGISPMHHPIMREDDFCSRAERRTDETD